MKEVCCRTDEKLKENLVGGSGRLTLSKVVVVVVDIAVFVVCAVKLLVSSDKALLLVIV